MKTIEEAVAWLYGTQRQGIKFGLDNTRRLLSELDLPHPGQTFFHVAGTNGKGSTCSFLEAALREHGVRTGLFTSPHLVRFNERIRVAGQEIPDRAVHDGISQLRDHVAANDWDHDPTFFELTLALALNHFRASAAEVVVLETGLGGRLDSTNAVDPVVSVITPIGLDHCKMLGGTLEAIAGEKAGIIKPGIPAVSAVQQPKAEAVLRARAEEVGTSIRFVDSPWPEDLPLGIPGQHQRDNAALAALALQAAGYALPDDDLERAFANVCWRARFEQLDLADVETPVVVDGAHNEMAARTLADTWSRRFGGEKATIVFGTVADKDCASVAAALNPVAAEWILVQTPSPRVKEPALIQEELEAGDLVDLAPCEIVEDPLHALETAIHRGRPVLVTGSLFLVGHIIAATEGDGNAYQRSRQ